MTDLLTRIRAAISADPHSDLSRLLGELLDAVAAPYAAGAEAMRFTCHRQVVLVGERNAGASSSTLVDAVCGALRALPIPAAPAREVSVRVKPLEWGGKSSSLDVWIANSLVGQYHVSCFVPNDERPYRLTTPGMIRQPAIPFPSLEDAKSAAQADYERRILSALEDE